MSRHMDGRPEPAKEGATTNTVMMYGHSNKRMSLRALKDVVATLARQRDELVAEVAALRSTYGGAR